MRVSAIRDVPEVQQREYAIVEVIEAFCEREVHCRTECHAS